jgi:ribonuclease HII
MVVGMDEVGRGAVAGPVCVGAVAVTTADVPHPDGLDDSKALSPAQRLALAPRVRAWCHAAALGWASAREVDHLGIIAALRTAGWRALDQLEGPGDGRCGIVLLDGKHDWLTPPPPTLEDHLAGDLPDADVRWRTVTLVGADRLAACVAGASVLAKCARDEVMVRLAQDHPAYGWEHNKGYGTRAHTEAIVRAGVTGEHRRTWKLGVA